MFSAPLLDINKRLTNNILYHAINTPSKSGCPLYCTKVIRLGAEVKKSSVLKEQKIHLNSFPFALIFVLKKSLRRPAGACVFLKEFLLLEKKWLS